MAVEVENDEWQRSVEVEDNLDNEKGKGNMKGADIDNEKDKDNVKGADIDNEKGKAEGNMKGNIDNEKGKGNVKRQRQREGADNDNADICFNGKGRAFIGPIGLVCQNEGHRPDCKGHDWTCKGQSYGNFAACSPLPDYFHMHITVTTFANNSCWDVMGIKEIDATRCTTIAEVKSIMENIKKLPMNKF